MPAKTKTELSPEEKDLLKAYLKTSPLILVRLKCHAILTREKGMPLKDIADIVSRHENTIGVWMKNWEKQRMASIFTGHEGIRTQVNSQKNKRRNQRSPRKPPSEYTLPKTFWDVPALKTYVQAIFGVVFESVRSYHFLLSFCNLSFKYPDTFDLHRNETHIVERMVEIQTEISPFSRMIRGKCLLPMKCEWNWKLSPEKRGSRKENGRSCT
ncbi:MAG: helix-turn-helix domain-containing protein [Candidatus Moraniibacteriota bacterium]|nr:MAG: helix-turn-helix domain-containing protein [Candidatus Moranbacteria bacterium]